MQRENDKIIIFKDTDKELYRLIDKIDITKFGVISFNGKVIKEIKIKNKKPYQVITIEKSTLLSEKDE